MAKHRLQYESVYTQIIKYFLHISVGYLAVKKTTIPWLKKKVQNDQRRGKTNAVLSLCSFILGLIETQLYLWHFICLCNMALWVNYPGYKTPGIGRQQDILLRTAAGTTAAVDFFGLARSCPMALRLSEDCHRERGHYTLSPIWWQKGWDHQTGAESCCTDRPWPDKSESMCAWALCSMGSLWHLQPAVLRGRAPSIMFIDWELSSSNWK